MCKFGIKGEYRVALQFVKRCLREIGIADYRFLMVKASLLQCLEEWDQLAPLLVYVNDRFTNDSEVFARIADVYAEPGAWQGMDIAHRSRMLATAALRMARPLARK